MLIRGVRNFVGLLIYASFFTGFRKHPVPRGWGGGGRGEVLPYMAFTGMCHWKGYIFCLPCPNRVYNSARDCRKQGI